MPDRLFRRLPAKYERLIAYIGIVVLATIGFLMTNHAIHKVDVEARERQYTQCVANNDAREKIRLTFADYTDVLVQASEQSAAPRTAAEEENRQKVIADFKAGLRERLRKRLPLLDCSVYEK